MVDDLLEDWQAGSVRTIGGVRVIGHRFSKESHDLRDFLARNRIPCRWLDVERDGEARELLHRRERRRRPRCRSRFLEDGSIVERPTILELAERLGVTAQPAADHYDLVIVGGGPAGPGGRRLRRVGGAQDGAHRARGARRAGRQSSRIENYLGFPTGLTGSRPRPARDRPGAPARRRDAHRPRRRGAARRGRRTRRRAQRRRRAERELRARGLRRVLPPARRPRVRGAHGRRRLLRRGDDRGPLLPRPARRRHRRRELGGAGRGLLLRVRAPGDDPRAAHARGVDVALPHRADRQPAQHRGPHGHHRDRRGGRRTPLRPARRSGPDGQEDLPARRCFVFIGARPRTDWLRRRRRARRARLHPRRPRRRRTRAGRCRAIPTCSRRACPASSWPATCARGRSSGSRPPSGEGSMAVSLVHQYLVDG